MTSPRKYKDTLAVLQGRADAFYEKAWGKPWPHQRSGSIDKTEIVPSGGGKPQAIDVDDNEDLGRVDDGVAYAYGSVPDNLDVPDRFPYLCFEGMKSVAKTLRLGADILDTLLVRDEYDLLREAIEARSSLEPRGIVVTGHPGIGKTAFLLYLLLHRLERKQPTAVQFSPDYYFIFDKYGSVAHGLSEVDVRLETCWALVDSNAQIIQPCTTLLVEAQLVIQASSPEPERWKEWLKQQNGYCIVSALPKELEIVAILKELKYDPASTLSLIRKWGPSIRTIIRIKGSKNPIASEKVLTNAASAAAQEICANPPSISNYPLPQSRFSSLLFIRPYRDLTWNRIKIEASGGAIPFIPTKYLSDIFELHRTKLSNDQSLQLFHAFNPHRLTRTIESWGLERKMHARLSSGGVPVRIFRDGEEREMPQPARLLTGNVAGIESVGVSDCFYWIPYAENFEGIDGVLGDTNGNIYIVQAAIEEHRGSLIAGVEKVWKYLHPDVRTGRTWHFIVVTDCEEVASALAKQFSKELDHFTLGPTRVTVWGCVLPQ